MCMRNRLSKCSKHLAFATCLFALGGSFSACQDEYFLDDEKPKWLNSSIYETLESNGNYQNYLRLIADPDVNSGTDENSSLVEILKRTGSKTVFVADDHAWEAFFKENNELPESNPWKKATSYENLTKSQKKLLLHTSMLNNAIVMENLSSSAGSKPERGSYLRRYTDVEAVDSVTRVAVTDLPVTYWSADRQTSEDNAKQTEVDQWSRIRNGGDLHYDSIYMVLDSSLTMMLQFTNEFMAKKHITDNDFRIITGQERVTSDIHIYSHRLDSADIVCENGYLNKTHRPLVPLANMAEVIRTNGKTNIFSHMLERFSVPFQNKTVGKLFSRLNENFEETDTLYSKRYYSLRSFGGGQLNRNELGTTFANTGTALLKFDPGWNGYYPVTASSPQEDMGAMFIPNDEQMVKFFSEEGGKTLIQEYTLNPTWNYSLASEEELIRLYKDIDQIPLDKIEKIISHCMQESFVASVPSKMTTLREETTLEQIYYPEDINAIDTVLLACNGAVYVMESVQIPSDFNCVATPAFLRSTNKIMYWAIYSDQKVQGMNLHYYAYLKAMRSRFSFFMPCDEGMLYYYDPMSFSSKYPRMIEFKYVKPDASQANNFPFPVSTSNALKTYNIANGSIGGPLMGTTISQGDFIDRLRQILEGSTIVHDGDKNTINTDEDEYYVAKNGMGIKVIRNTEGNKVIAAQGGFQLENERAGLAQSNPGIIRCDVNESGDYKNGCTFTLNAPLIPASRSVFSVLSNIERGKEGSMNDYLDQDAQTNPFFEFFELCDAFDQNLILKSGLVDEKEYNMNVKEHVEARNRAINLYRTFLSDKTVDRIVQFFNNYNYTVFIPSNEAMQEAIQNGLPTWESIQKEYDSRCDEDGYLTNKKDSSIIQNQIIYLTNFIRSHFADKSLFADNSEMTETEITSSSFNEELGTFVKHNVIRVKEGNGTVLKVRDNNEKGTRWNSTIKEWKDVNGQDVPVINVMTCDRSLSGEVKKSLNADGFLSGIKQEGASYAVIHLIDGVLKHTSETPDVLWGDNYDPDKARKYKQNFAIR